MPTLELETMRCVADGPPGRLHLNRLEALNAANWAWVRMEKRAERRRQKEGAQ